MNFLTDKDGVTKKDMAFLVVMIMFIIVCMSVLIIGAHDYFTSGGLNEANMALFTMIFMESAKIMIIVVSFFYGTQVAVSILSNGKLNLPTLFKGNKTESSGSDSKPEDWVPPSDREEAQG